MTVGKEGRLSIAFLGSFAEYPYDGKGSDGVGTLGPVVDGRATVEFSEFRIPPLQFIPGSGCHSGRNRTAWPVRRNRFLHRAGSTSTLTPPSPLSWATGR